MLTGPLAVPRAALYRRCTPSSLGFASTVEVPDLAEVIGQERAVEAIDLAMSVSAPGFNVFAMGPPGIGKATALRQFLEARAVDAPIPSDWCYVHDFADPRRPKALRLAPGIGVELKDAMTQLCLELQGAIPAAFESSTYHSRKTEIESAFERRRDAALAELEERARPEGVALIRTPIGLGLAPVRDGEVLGSDDFRRLEPDERERIGKVLARFEQELQEVLRPLPQWQRESRRRMRDLNSEVVQAAVGHLIDEMRTRFAQEPAIAAHLDAVEADVVARAAEFLAAAAQPEGSMEATRATIADDGPFRRYRVNLLVDHSRTTSAPIVVEDHPTHANLVGRIEYIAQLGALLTDFMMIRPGALHRANGGYLVIDADRILLEPYAWEELKRAVRTREVRVEPLAQSLGLLTTATLAPEPIPLQFKVALVGDRRLYYLLAAYDREFLELFKVAADFSDDVEWTDDRVGIYARLIATLSRREGLLPLDASAVGRVIEGLARMAEDSGKLSTHMGRLVDLLREADQVATRRGRSAIGRGDIQRAVDARRRRASRLSERVQEEIARETIRIETTGEVVGQVNALTVFDLGGERFGHPSRVTASARAGRGEVIDIEREVELGGPIHSKGVLILAGFLGVRFGPTPLTLRGSLVFEQSYGMVEGDSASLAELCALLSAIGGVGIRQSLAVTGSVDQRGNVQAIGGVNEKVEGFFEACAARGLTGAEGVIIPTANVRHLMLSARVRRAIRTGRFSLYAVSSVDEAVELLTGLPAGAPGADGEYPSGTVNGAVRSALAQYVEAAKRAAAPGESITSERAGAGPGA